jgi:hypothetical protein
MTPSGTTRLSASAISRLRARMAVSGSGIAIMAAA